MKNKAQTMQRNIAETTGEVALVGLKVLKDGAIVTEADLGLDPGLQIDTSAYAYCACGSGGGCGGWGSYRKRNRDVPM